MRAIDADALKEDLTRFYDNEVTARELIDEQPTVVGWISVKDRLPKLGQRVMAHCRAGIMTFLRYDGDVWFEMSSRNEYLLSFVTHWQPLPEPPKGE